ncbi:MAG: hypothetical protein HQ582_01635 [Planctomycetes bacterium]|nr:hypothetical protein [Planctomycetota bacterium]
MNVRRVLCQLATTTTLLAVVASASIRAAEQSSREFNGPYTGKYLNRVAFPIGGIGAGMFCLEGTGAISHMSVRNSMEFFHEPTTFAAVCVLGETPEKNVTRVLEGPIPDWKYFGGSGAGNGSGGKTYGFPRFRQAEFSARFPFATIKLNDRAVPLDVQIVGWSPFTPPEPDPSSLPIGALEYQFHNTTDRACKAVFSFNTRNFMGNGSIGPIDGGFALYAKSGDDRDQGGAFAALVDGEKTTIVDHCWFRGRWFDALTIAWNNVAAGTILDNPPVPENAPGASLAVPFQLGAGEKKTIRLLTCWYVPKTSIRYGRRVVGPAFRQTPSRGTAKNSQQTVSGFLGRGLANSFDPDGDGPTGTLTSPEFPINKRHLHFLVGGGPFMRRTCVDLLIDGAAVQSVCGKQSEQLAWATFDLADLQGKKAKIQLVDKESDNWGHLLADHFVLSDEPIKTLLTGEGNQIINDPKRLTVVADFEGDDYAEWVADPPVKPSCCEDGVCKREIPATYVPWYSTQFDSVEGVAEHWKANYAELRGRSGLFRDAFYDSTLAPEVIEAVAANLTILKSPTVLRQHDGRLWCFEGCSDSRGCCSGSCTHVWNYAQAFCHLFPVLERSLRQTEYHESLDENGRQAFRANLPIAEGGGSFDAADGQLGGIMKAYREWRISGDDQWLARFWPLVKLSLNYMIQKYDPRHTGLLEEEHHNTYDINYFGPDGHCGSFYLGALAAAVKMGKAAGDDVPLYGELLEKGRKRMESELYNGDYFIQIVQKEGLDDNFSPLDSGEQSEAYRGIAELVNEQGPKYQYGNGCLSDGVLGLWMAAVCGIDDEVVDTAKVRSHLLAVHKHNLKLDLSTHANPQRPTFAMGDDGGLLLCSWPKGGKPLLPFVYSDEVWTGIEYQVASHLMLLGCVDEGLDVVRACRRRYDGVRRNPFNEYECGHWYARALSSYGLLQGLTGVRYDAVTKTLHVDSQVGDFRSFLCTRSGFGVVEVKGGRVTLDVRHGEIPIRD